MQADEYLALRSDLDKLNESGAEHLRRMFAARWSELSAFPRKPLEDIERWQLERLGQVVDYAYENVPLYRKKYRAVGYAPGGIRSWADFASLPLLTKGELIEGFPDQIVAKREDFGLSTRSSGTSGQFVTIGVSEEALCVDTLQGARQLIQQTRGRFQPDDVCLTVASRPWWFESIAGTYRSAWLPTTATMPEIVAEAQRLRPRVVTMYPSSLEQDWQTAKLLREAGVEVIVFHSEQSHGARRRELSRELGVQVLDEYSSEELTRIALECGERVYHLEEDACYIEILDERGAPLPAGTRGMVVGTNLINLATPLIRYRQNDWAALGHVQGCACGSNFRALGPPEGRLLDSIVTSVGARVPALSLIDVAYSWFWEHRIPVQGLTYQIIQELDGSVHVYLTPSLYTVDAARVKESLYDVLPKDMRVEVHFVAEIPEKAAGKHRAVLSRRGSPLNLGGAV